MTISFGWDTGTPANPKKPQFVIVSTERMVGQTGPCDVDHARIIARFEDVPNASRIGEKMVRLYQRNHGDAPSSALAILPSDLRAIIDHGGPEAMRLALKRAADYIEVLMAWGVNQPAKPAPVPVSAAAPRPIHPDYLREKAAELENKGPGADLNQCAAYIEWLKAELDAVAAPKIDKHAPQVTIIQDDKRTFTDDDWTTLQEIIHAMTSPGVFVRVEAFLSARGIEDPTAAIKSLEDKAV